MAKKRRRRPKNDGQATKKMGIGLAIFGVLAILFAQLYPMLAADYGPSGATGVMSGSGYRSLEKMGMFLIFIGLIVTQLRNIRRPPEKKTKKTLGKKPRRHMSSDLPRE